MIKLRPFFPVLILICASVVIPVTLFAQVDRANLSGTVTDPSAALVPDALVELSSLQTGFTRSVRTRTDGIYRFSSLPAGLYLVTVTKDGFETAVIDGIQLLVGQNRTANAALRVGSLATEVHVNAAPVAIDTTSAEIGASISGEQLESLPLNGRNWASLMMLAPGAVNTGEGGQGNIRFFGRARDDNNWTFDGVDASGIKDPRQEASLRLVMSTEAIAEFRVSSTGYTAESGTGAGAQVNLVSKSGTNRLTGGMFDFIRDEALDERRILDALPDEPDFRLQQYGATFGGPIVRNRTFFFASFEGLRQTLHVANGRPALVPSAAFRQRIASQQPTLTPVLAAYPLGTRATGDPDIDEYVGRRRLSWNEDSFLVRVDHRINEQTPLVFRVNGVNGVIDSEIRSDLLETRRSESFPMNATAQLQRVASATTLFEGKFGWNRSPLERLDAGLGPEGYEIQRGFTPTRATVFSEEKPQALSYVGSMVTQRGSHTIKIGGEFRQIHVDVGNSASTSLRWGSLTDFAANRTNRIRVDGELPLQRGRRWYGIGFGQTEWRATPELTLNLGVRYEYYSVMTEANGNGNVIDLERCPPTASSLFCAAGTPWYFPDKNNVAPRIGLAWSPSERWVLRGGYGIYYSPGQNDDVTAAFDSLAVRGDLTTVAAYPATPFIGAALARANSRPRALQRDRDDMYAHIYSASLQRNLGAAFVGQIGYVGSRGNNVFNRIFVNTIDPSSGVRPAAPFLTTQIDQKGNLGRTEYDAMLVTLQRTFRNRFLFQANYILGDSRDNNAGNGEGSEWQNARCGECEWGPSDFDARHVFTLNNMVGLPLGVDFSWVLAAKSGRPINVTIERAGPDGSDVNQRPNLVSGIEAVTGGTPDAWLNPAAFAVPAANQFGNSPRNGYRGPSNWQVDLSLTKRIRAGGRSAFEIRLDGFNMFNTAQYGNPARVFSQPLTFGKLTPLNSQPTGTGTARQFQLGLRFSF